MKIRYFSALLVLVVGSANGVFGGENHLGNLEVSAGYWMTSGDLNWDTSFDFYDEGLGYWVEGRSRLEWKTDSDYITLEALYSKDKWFGRLQYATGDIDQGTCWDSDWAIYPGYPLTNEPMLRSFDPADGENDFYIFDLGYVFKSTSVGSASVFLGYQEKTLNLHNYDPVIYDIVDWQPAYEIYNEGLASTYDIEFTGFRIGVEGELTCGEKTAFKGLLAYYPRVDAEGVGYWNLRDLRFTQTGDGTGIEFVGCIVYNVTDAWSAELGYRFQEFEQSGGMHKYYSPDGSGEIEWERAKSMQAGIFLTMSWVF